MGCPIRDRCPDEDTIKCDTCNKGAKLEPVKLDTKDAIEYLKEANEYYDRVLGDKAKQLKEYRVNQMAIKALESELQYEEFLKMYTAAVQ
ncbi:MAG: hypothetical protein K0R92_534 [Lachnospiraceae bacterium]|jgi:hypothetical protein|nr:hypothetical protein [Lachnospiraceae bacterium]